MSGGLSEVSIRSAGDAGLRLGDLGELDLSDHEIPVKPFARPACPMPIQHDCRLEVIRD